MRIVRESFAVVGGFFIAAGFLLAYYGRTRGIGGALPFALIYAAADAGMIAFSLVPRELE